MLDASDMELLRDYDRQGSEEAFAELVRRHIHLVYSAAFRHVGMAAQVEEITQAVFIILARKAASLRPDTILESWLHETTRLTALSFQRGERRRRFREQEAYMQSTLQDSAGASAWEQLAPLVDEAVSRLGTKDRDAVMLRFFKDKSLREVAEALKVNEPAAQRRVRRAVEKLRRFFTKRGVVLTAAALTGAISANSVQAAPAALAQSVTALAVAKGAAVSGSTLILVKGALQLMALAKAKTSAMIGAAVVFAAGVTAVAVDESLWQTKHGNLDKAPSVVIIRPSKYDDTYTTTNANGAVIWHTDSSKLGGSDGRMICQNVPFVGLLKEAYSFPISRMILPADIPTNHFDLMLTVRSHNKEALQEAIEKQLGFTARREKRETNVLVLKVKDPGLLAAHASQHGSKMDFKNGEDFWAYVNFPITDEAGTLEIYFHKPILVDPGLSGNYDITYQWKDWEDKKKALSHELAEAGLELVPTHMPIDVLVVSRHGRFYRLFHPSHGASDAFQGDLADFHQDRSAFQGDLATLQGTWEGREIVDKAEDSASLVFSGTNMEFRSLDRSFDCYKAAFSLREDTNPKQLVAVVTESLNIKHVGQTVNTIYQIKNGVLKVTANNPGSPRQLIFKMEKPLPITANANAKTIATTSPSTAPAAGSTSGAGDDSSWEIKPENWDEAPEVVRIRPARFPDKNGSTSSRDGRIISYGAPFVGLLNEAYSFPISRMILPANKPTNRFDFILMLRSHKKEGLQKAIQDQFGLTARRETRETDVLLLKVKNPRLLAVHASKHGSRMDFKNGVGFLAYVNFPLTSEVGALEGFFNKPVIVEPGLSGNYDLTFQWKDARSRTQDLSNELARAGLELVPARMPIKRLVVEKADLAASRNNSAAFQGDLADFKADSTRLHGDLATLQGAWEGQEMVDNTEGSASLVFSGTNMEFRSSDRSFDCYKATFSLREDTNPKQLVAVIAESLGTRNVGQTVNAIYQINNGALTMTAHSPGHPNPPTDFDQPGARRLVFKKEKPF